MSEAYYPSTQKFVDDHAGLRTIDKILIANNGIAAVKCIRSIRRWAYSTFGDMRHIKFVVMATPDDLKANAEFVRLADQHVDVPGGSNNHNYANVDLIIDIAVRMEVQAVWAGWGHASENPLLPDGLDNHNIAFMGPPGHAMRSLGDKISSSIVAQSANVPTMPWSGSGLSIDFTTNKVGNVLKVPDPVYRQGCVTTAEEGLASALKIGFPVMIKASEGGGGKGIRKVVSTEAFVGMFRQVQAEVPGSPIFIMKLASGARHLEVQLLADEHNQCIALCGRDCSVQRRHQKIIEEAPACIASEQEADDMEKAAVRLGKMVGYVSTGTVEWLYNPDGTFYFLELNPRLQVEHPCTELVSGVNLPAAQLQIAMGLRLERIADIRKFYNMDETGTSPIPFENATLGSPLDGQIAKPRPRGHVIAVRITAENPEEGFKPSSGGLQELTFRSSPDVWGYFSVGAMGGLHEYADSQFGHCFAWGATREHARRSMICALNEISIRGDFVTTVNYISTMMETPDFIDNNITTEWLDGLIEHNMKAERPERMRAIIAGSAHIASQEISKRYGEFSQALGKGQILPLATLRPSVHLDVVYEGTKYSMEALRTGPVHYMLGMNGTYVRLLLYSLSDGGSLVRCGGDSTVVYMKEEIERYRMSISGKACIFDKENDPSLFRAVSAGKLLRYMTEDGEHVNEGQPFAEIEVMKMVMSLYSKASGKINHELVAGHIMTPGDLIARFALDDPEMVKKPKDSSEGFASPASPTDPIQGQVHQQFRVVVENISNVLGGFAIPTPFAAKRIDYLVESLFETGTSRELPLFEAKEILSSLSGRISEEVQALIEEQLEMYKNNISSIMSKFPATKLGKILDHHAATLDSSDQDTFLLNTGPLQELIKRHQNGIKAFFLGEVLQLMKEYLSIEKIFAQESTEFAINRLCKEHSEDLDKVVGAVVSHVQVNQKNKLIMCLLDALFKSERNLFKQQDTAETAVLDCLEEFAQLSVFGSSEVALKARYVLIQHEVPSFKLRQDEIASIFSDATTASAGESVEKLVSQATSVFDVLIELMYHTDFKMQKSSLEVYVRRAFVAYDVMSVDVDENAAEDLAVATWRFRIPTRHPDDSEGEARKLNLQRLSPNPDSGGDTLQRKSIQISVGDFQQYAAEHAENPAILESPVRVGVMAAFSSMEHLEAKFALLLNQFRSLEDSDVEEPINILNIAIKLQGSEASGDDAVSKQLHKFITDRRDDLYALQIRRVTFLVYKFQEFPNVFTYRERLSYGEDTIYRRIDPALAFKLEIGRLANYNISHCPTKDPKLHLFYGVHAADGKVDRRFFVRTVMRDALGTDLDDTKKVTNRFQKAGDSIVLGALNELEILFSNPKYGKTDNNHIFINAVPVFNVQPEIFLTTLSEIIQRYAARLLKLRVLEAEIRLRFRPSPMKPEFCVRVCVNNMSGYYPVYHAYREVMGPDGTPLYQGLKGLDLGPLHNVKCSQKYMPKERSQVDRYSAQSLGSTYVHDYIELIREILKNQWHSISEATQGTTTPKSLVDFTQLVLDGDKLAELAEGEVNPNRIGMVAWKLRYYSPEAPEGRDMILIANDITHVIGSFGPTEDKLFYLASQLARKLKIPRIYVSVNSGARIGLAQEVLSKYKVAFTDPERPWRGFEYLYLTPEDFKSLDDQGSVKGELIEVAGESRYKITDVIGKQDGIGVECLRGSGMIAGETSAAYNDIFTCTLVSSRSVGIGAYLVRLGQRTIQGKNSHIILTGYTALNKVLGKDVYTSSMQLGGPQIMYNNGVSHVTVNDDFEGMRAILQWIAYLPPSTGVSIPRDIPCFLGSNGKVYQQDPVERDVEYYPPAGQYDPRCLIVGDDVKRGLFDSGSFMEMLGGWAKTVVTGRARLGGIPVGVIAVETRPQDLIIPADPANVNSESQVTTQAGQVWYPDSAYKTAQAIKDIDKEKLPLFILANWRGFSGGMHDMYEEVLKFGAMIVDNLNTFKQPVFVYLPPGCELRGGAWVVVDPTINPAMMEMYADDNSRGGVLEAEGTVSIKYKKKTAVLTMYRLDAEYKRLKDQVDQAEDETDKALFVQSLEQRYELLAPMYHSIAVQFADLHDTPGRMKAKNCINAVVSWKNARRFFHARLQRRMYVQYLLKQIKTADPATSEAQGLFTLKRWFFQEHSTQNKNLWENDDEVVSWVRTQLSENGTLKPKSSIQTNLSHMQRESTVEKVKTMGGVDTETAFQCVSALLTSLSPAQRSELQQSLSQSSA